MNSQTLEVATIVQAVMKVISTRAFHREFARAFLAVHFDPDSDVHRAGEGVLARAMEQMREEGNVKYRREDSMRNQTEILRRIIEDCVAQQFRYLRDRDSADPGLLGYRVAQDVISRLHSARIQIVKRS